MLKWFSIVALLFQAAPAAADDTPDADDVLRLDSWSIEGDRSSPKLTVHLTNVGPKPFRMIDAHVTFSDVLGEGVAGVVLARDLSAEPGQRIVHTDTVRDAERLLKMQPKHVSAAVRVKAVLYADGSTERFERPDGRPAPTA